MSAPSISAKDFLDGGPLRGTALRTCLLCCLLMLTEGMDTYGVGYVSKFLIADYRLAPSVLGLIYTGTVVASLLGAVAVAPLSDRIGRRPILVGSSLMMGICTLLTPLAHTAEMLFVVRFLIGMGFGAAVPAAFAMTADYAPQRHRAFILMTMSSGVALGMVLAGVLAAEVIPLLGWRALLYLNGLLSLVWTAALLIALPESLLFLESKRPGSAALRRLTARIARERGVPAPEFAPPPTAPLMAAQPVRAIFADGRAAMTVLLWLAMSATYCVEFFISYWLPTVLMDGGASVQTAGYVIAVGKVGSIVGALVIGAVMDRAGAARVLAATFLVTAILLWVLGQAPGFMPVLAAALVVATCFFLDGSFAGIQAYTASAYPGELRATGTGWVTGFARLIGGGAGTLSGGWFVQLHWTAAAIAAVLGIPMLLGSAALLRLHRRAATGRPAAEPTFAQPLWEPR